MELCNLAKRICALGIIGVVSLALVGCGGQSALEDITPGQSLISKTYVAHSPASILSNLAPDVADIFAGKCPAQNVVSNYLYMPQNNAANSATTTHGYYGVLSGNCTTDVLKSEGLVAMTALPIGSLSSLYGDYTGFTYDTDATKIRGLTTTISGNSFAVNLAADSVSTHVNFTAVDSPSVGFVQGNVDGRELICMAGKDVQNSGKNTLFCLIENPADPTKPFNMILASE